MEDFRRFIQKRHISTAEGKRNDDDKATVNYSGIDAMERANFFQSFPTIEDSEEYDTFGQRKLEQTLYYEEEEFEHSQLQNLEGLEEAKSYIPNAGKSIIESSITDMNAVDEEKFNQLRKKVKREAAPFLKSTEVDLKPLAQFILPEDMVREDDITWHWDSLISEIISHPDVRELTKQNEKDDNDEDIGVNRIRDNS